MNDFLRVGVHIPSHKLTQEDLDTILECVNRMAVQQGKGGRKIFMLMDNVNIPSGITELTANDGTMDFVVKLDNKKELK